MKYRFDIQQINRAGRTAVLVGCIKFIDLNDNVRFTYRNFDTEEGKEYYQRRIDSNRITQIISYIENSIAYREKLTTQPLFPTSIVLAFGNDSLNFEDNISSCDVTLPNDILIVDGQHRFAAMQALYNRTKNKIDQQIFSEDYQKYQDIIDYLNNYKFSCSILLNYDIWEQAQVFASVNFNQRKVNKSLFYEIYGINIPEDGLTIPRQNEIYIAHQLVSYLNGNDKSPFSGFIKMLGTGKGFISQAFLVEQFLTHLSSTGIWSDVAQDLKINSKSSLYNYAAAELSAFFAAVRHAFTDFWPHNVTSKPSVLCKTTGIGALMKFLKDLHYAMPQELLKKLKQSPSDLMMYAELIVYFDNNIYPLKSEGKRLFSTEKGGQFNGTGGTGMQNSLYKEIYRLWANI